MILSENVIMRWIKLLVRHSCFKGKIVSSGRGRIYTYWKRDNCPTSYFHIHVYMGVYFSIYSFQFLTRYPPQILKISSNVNLPLSLQISGFAPGWGTLNVIFFVFRSLKLCFFLLHMLKGCKIHFSFCNALFQNFNCNFKKINTVVFN